jgi:hypothetical protein
MTIDVELLPTLLRYEPETGKLFWLERESPPQWNAKCANKEAFIYVNTVGYHQGAIFGRGYLAHRVIWALVHGEWPTGEIDHINGNRADNRLINLRSVSHKQNSHNQKLRNTNTSGVCGVSWVQRDARWYASIHHDGKSKSLGQYKDFNDAVAARKAAEIEFGYHPNHGRQAA